MTCRACKGTGYQKWAGDVLSPCTFCEGRGVYEFLPTHEDFLQLIGIGT
jgi:DnaJ-class molecular chaperone